MVFDPSNANDRIKASISCISLHPSIWSNSSVFSGCLYQTLNGSPLVPKPRAMVSKTLSCAMNVGSWDKVLIWYCPGQFTLPISDSMCPFNILINVDLPAPLAPIIATLLGRGMAKLVDSNRHFSTRIIG